MAPVGLAFEHVERGHDSPSLRRKDGEHPSPSGTVLAALAIAASLLDRGDGDASARLRSVDCDALAE